LLIMGDCDNDYARWLEYIKYAVRIARNEQSTITSVKNRCDLGKSSQMSKSCIQMAHEQFAPAFLITFVVFVGLLDIDICGKK